MKKMLFLIPACILISTMITAQSVGINNATPDASAILDVKSTTKGLLIPRMLKAERDLIASPATGLLIYQTDNTAGYYYYNGANWAALAGGGTGNYWTLNGNDIYSANTGNTGIGTSTPLAKLSVQTPTGNYGIIHSDGTITLGTYIGNGEGWLGTKSNHPLTFFANNSNELMTLLANGNFGIGTTTPFAKLHVAGNIKIDGNNTMEFGAGIPKEVSAGKIGYQTYGSFDALDIVGAGTLGSNRKITFWNEGGAEFRGNVGVGTAATTYKMDIADRIRLRSGALGTAGLWLNSPDNSATIAFIGVADASTVGIYGNNSQWGLAMNTNSGNVGIKTLVPVNKLQIGSMGATGFNGNDFAIGNGTNALGIFQSNTGTAFTSSNAIFLQPGNGTGRVGINTTSPRATLEVFGTANISALGIQYTYMNDVSYYNDLGNNSTPGGEIVPDISILTSGRVYATEFDAYSDARIKNIIGISNTTKDLQTISDLQISDYTMKDKIQHGNKLYKKVIAQEVEKVYPQVVSKHTDFIPNVYQLTNKIEKVANGFLLSFTNRHNISNTAKKLRVLLSETEAMQEMEIISIPSDTQVIINAPGIKSDKIFVYGEEVDDFRTIDYEGLTTLNISATQELSKLVKKQQAIIERLEKRLAILETKLPGSQVIVKQRD